MRQRTSSCRAITPDIEEAPVARSLLGRDMERHYYVERERETSETTDRLEAARIAAAWTRRGYKVDTVVVDVTDESVQLADVIDACSTPLRPEAPAAASSEPGKPGPALPAGGGTGP